MSAMLKFVASVAVAAATPQNCGPNITSLASGAGLVVDTSVWINGTVEDVWDVLSDVGSWRDWNDVFQIDAMGSFQVGSFFALSSFFRGAARPFQRITRPSEVTLWEPADRVCWKPVGVLGMGGLHCFQLCAEEDGTIVHNFEQEDVSHIGGFLVQAAMDVYSEAAQDAFNRFNEQLASEVCARLPFNVSSSDADSFSADSDAASMDYPADADWVSAALASAATGETDSNTGDSDSASSASVDEGSGNSAIYEDSPSAESDSASADSSSGASISDPVSSSEPDSSSDDSVSTVYP